MTPLHSIQKDRGCTVGQGCEGHECTCRRTVRLVLEGMREPSSAMLRSADDSDDDVMVARGRAYEIHTGMIDTALKEVG